MSNVNYIKAKPGYKFVLTDYGFEYGRIRSKFEENSPQKQRYEKAVPQSWITKNYVKEVSCE